jgi:hypothetical protein
MTTFNLRKHLSQAALYALVASFAILASMATIFFTAEPSITYGQTETDEFLIVQTITDETAFTVLPTDVTMVGSIAGLTGGNATGTTFFNVKSNNASGYYVEISFEGDPEAMVGDIDGDLGILDYQAATMEPTYSFTTSAAAQIAYTINATNTLRIDDSFIDAGSACGNTTGGGGACWMAPSTTAVRIIDSNQPDASGASSSIMFKIHVPNNPSPVLTAQTYTATATLSLFTQ